MKPISLILLFVTFVLPINCIFSSCAIDLTKPNIEFCRGNDVLEVKIRGYDKKNFPAEMAGYLTNTAGLAASRPNLSFRHPKEARGRGGVFNAKNANPQTQGNSYLKFYESNSGDVSGSGNSIYCKLVGHSRSAIVESQVKTAISLALSLSDFLKDLESENVSKIGKIRLTGLSLGGAIAIYFVAAVHYGISMRNKTSGIKDDQNSDKEDEFVDKDVIKICKKLSKGEIKKLEYLYTRWFVDESIESKKLEIVSIGTAVTPELNSLSSILLKYADHYHIFYHDDSIAKFGPPFASNYLTVPGKMPLVFSPVENNDDVSKKRFQLNLEFDHVDGCGKKNNSECQACIMDQVIPPSEQKNFHFRLMYICKQPGFISKLIKFFAANKKEGGLYTTTKELMAAATNKFDLDVFKEEHPKQNAAQKITLSFSIQSILQDGSRNFNELGIIASEKLPIFGKAAVAIPVDICLILLAVKLFSKTPFGKKTINWAKAICYKKKNISSVDSLDKDQIVTDDLPLNLENFEVSEPNAN